MTSPRLHVPADDASGFTLIELMIALVVIAVGVLALSGVQMRSSNDVYNTGTQSRALALAQQRIEITRSRGYVLAVSDSGNTTPFAWRTQVDSIGPELKQIAVAVSWSQPSGAKTMRLSTMLSNR